MHPLRHRAVFAVKNSSRKRRVFYSKYIKTFSDRTAPGPRGKRTALPGPPFLREKRGQGREGGSSPTTNFWIRHWRSAISAQTRRPIWSDMASVDTIVRWREDWSSAFVLNRTIVTDPTIRQPGFDLPRHTWSLMNCFRTGEGPCRAVLHKSIVMSFSP